jgi:hypothetical protein
MITRRWNPQGGILSKRARGRSWLGLATVVALVLSVQGVFAVTEPKYGGLLNATLEEAPPSFSLHEEATAAAVWPVMPCYSNLVLFDPL